MVFAPNITVIQPQVEKSASSAEPQRFECHLPVGKTGNILQNPLFLCHRFRTAPQAILWGLKKGCCKIL